MKLEWDLKKIKPRLDIQIEEEKEKRVLDSVLPFPYRMRRSKENTRHYKFPSWFRAQKLRDNIEAKLKDELEKLQ